MHHTVHMDHTVHTAHMLRGEPRRGSPQTCRFAPRPGLASVWGAGSPQTNKFIRELGKQTGDRTRVLAAPRRAALPLPQSSSGRFHRQWTPGHSEAIQRPFRGHSEADGKRPRSRRTSTSAWTSALWQPQSASGPAGGGRWKSSSGNPIPPSRVARPDPDLVEIQQLAEQQGRGPDLRCRPRPRACSAGAAPPPSAAGRQR